MEIRAFGQGDVSDAKELSDAAGWNQIETDWERIVRVQPDGCLSAWIGSRLVGTTTFVTYGAALAWVGMVLVHPAFRGRGIGTRLFRAAIDALKQRQMPVVGLDATDSGRPLYEKEGFREVAPIERWTGSLQQSAANRGGIEQVHSNRAETIVRFDRRLAGVDRGLLIRQLLGEEEGKGFVARGDDGTLQGYVLTRPGRSAWQVGPVVAHQEDTAGLLLDAAARFLDGREVVLDVVEGFGFSALLEERGLTPSRRLTRMTAPRPSGLLTNRSLVAAAGFEWG